MLPVTIELESFERPRHRRVLTVSHSRFEAFQMAFLSMGLEGDHDLEVNDFVKHNEVWYMDSEGIFHIIPFPEGQ